MKKEEKLAAIAKRLRKHSLEMTTRTGSGHPTTCMSAAEIMACLYFDEMKYDIGKPHHEGNDEFVLSKGHASPILWAAMAEAGIIPKTQLKTYREYPSPLEGHPTPLMPWIKAATGSLGQGLSVGVGMAVAMNWKRLPTRVYVLLGDGECSEGNIWEAAELAPKLRLMNIVAILDGNRLGQSGPSLHEHDMQAWKKKWEAFGWEAQIIDGHNITQVLAAFKKARRARKPAIIIAKTYKGKGVSFLENKEGWHGKALPEDKLKKALKELGEIPEVDASKMVKAPAKVRTAKPAKRKVPGPEYKKDEQVATRDAYGNMLKKLGKHTQICALDGDVENSTRAYKFHEEYPKRFIECYIAEQNMAAMAIGLQAKGFVPFAATFSAFTSRAHDQIRMSAISRANIKWCGSHAGASIGEDGPSQMGLEDLATFRCLPGSIVLYPCDAVSGEKCTELLLKHNGMAYIRTTRPKTPVIYKNTEKFKIGGSKILRRGKKIAIIAAGVTVHEALKAADMLENVTVIDAYSVKPIDKRTLLKETRNKRVIVVEDHYPEGGLADAVRAAGIPVAEHLCIKEIPQSGNKNELMHAYKIDTDAIIRAARSL